jgi:hypothetical protein
VRVCRYADDANTISPSQLHDGACPGRNAPHTRVLHRPGLHAVRVHALRQHTHKRRQPPAVLVALDYGRRSMTLGKGLARTTFEVAALPSDALFGLREMGLSESDLRSATTRLPWADFERW